MHIKSLEKKLFHSQHPLKKIRPKVHHLVRIQHKYHPVHRLVDQRFHGHIDPTRRSSKARAADELRTAHAEIRSAHTAARFAKASKLVSGKRPTARKK